MNDEIKYEYEDIKLRAKLTYAGRQGILKSLVKKMAKKGWQLANYSDGGLTNISVATFKRDIQYQEPKKQSYNILQKILKAILYIILGLFILIFLFATFADVPKEKSALEEIVYQTELKKIQKPSKEEQKKREKIAEEEKHKQELGKEQKAKEAKIAREKLKTKKTKLLKLEINRMKTEDVSVIAKVTNQNGIITVHGTTNLPNHTQLVIYVSNDLYFASDEVKVENGKFISKAFKDKEKPLFNETYEIAINTKSFKEQIPAVQQIIGKNGKNLMGKLIKHNEFNKENELEYKTFVKVTNSTDRKEIVSITSENIKKVIKSLKKNYNIQATNSMSEKLNKFKMCWNDRACEIYADKVQIQGTYKTVEALTSSRVSPRYYQKVCSAIMIALTDAHKELIEPQIPQYFNYASQHGRSSWEVLGVEVTISISSDGLLGCEFYKNKN